MMMIRARSRQSSVVAPLGHWFPGELGELLQFGLIAHRSRRPRARQSSSSVVVGWMDGCVFANTSTHPSIRGFFLFFLKNKTQTITCDERLGPGLGRTEGLGGGTTGEMGEKCGNTLNGLMKTNADGMETPSLGRTATGSDARERRGVALVKKSRVGRCWRAFCATCDRLDRRVSRVQSCEGLVKMLCGR